MTGLMNRKTKGGLEKVDKLKLEGRTKRRRKGSAREGRREERIEQCLEG